MSGETLNRFSLREFYQGRKGARLISRIEVVLLGLLVLCAPLPFGSVENYSVLLIELAALVCVLLWFTQLIFFGNTEQLLRFRKLYQAEKETLQRSPFFHRHYWLARFFHLITFGRWPRRNATSPLLDDEQSAIPVRLEYYSFFGYPVKNTGIEWLACFTLFLFSLQVIPLPHFVVALFSPGTAEYYQRAAAAADVNLSFYPLSVNSFLTISKILEYSSYFMIYLVIVNSSSSRSLFRALLVSVIISGVFQAGYGLFEFLSGHQHIFTYAKKFDRDCATGTFINRNHFALYLEMTLPILLGFVAGLFGPLKLMKGRLIVRISRFFELDGGRIFLLTFLIILVSVGLVFSLSRSGIAFGIISCATFFLLFPKANHVLFNRRTYWIFTVLAAVAIAVFIGLDPVMQRFQEITEELSPEGPRWKVWKDTALILFHFPLMGTGIGTFREVFPSYQDFNSEVAYIQAHNDYLELLSEGGIIMVLIYAAFFSILFSRLKALMSLPLKRSGALRIGAFCSLLSLALHSITDFGLQIPAIPVAAAVILGFFMRNSPEDRSKTVE